MDAVWLILDSLSATSTPFSERGADTMPRLADIAERHGVVFTNAYAPGPSSPSSHASFFTGELPSVTGMHEATPFFDDNGIQTIAGALGETNRSLLVSTNPFIFNGLDRDFDEVNDFRGEQYLIFDSASDPGRPGFVPDYDSAIRRYLAFAMKDGKPIRSLLNGLMYKLWSKDQTTGLPDQISGDDGSYRYADATNEEIRSFLADSSDAFVVANYMDVHPPLNASPAAIEQIDSECARDDLPVGVGGNEIYERIQEGDEESGDLMYDLYRASVYELDQKLAPLVEDLIDDGAFVVVTADHGLWFRRNHELDEERIHVPLVLFAPEESPRCVDSTVNLRQLPRTTTELLLDTDCGFSGPSLFEVTEDQLSITEYIHHSAGDGPVTIESENQESFERDIAAIIDDARVDYTDSEFTERRGSAKNIERLIEVIEKERSEEFRIGHSEHSVDETTQNRLKDLGYID